MEMVFTDTLIKEHIVDVLISDANSFGAGADLTLHVISAPFVASPTLIDGDVSLATGDGFDAKVMATVSTEAVFDVDKGTWGFQLNPAAGGLNFTATAVPDPELTVYGFALRQNDRDFLIATFALVTPIVITHIGQTVPVDEVIGFMAAPPLGE